MLHVFFYIIKTNFFLISHKGMKKHGYLSVSIYFPIGIFSDTHLLTMMYIGEMCFWAVKYEDCSVDSTERKEDRLHFRDIGTQILHKYVLVCDGPLQGQGWNTENAKEILSILQ